MSHHHLIITERECLHEMILKGFSVRAIARHLGRTASTISRELKRNGLRAGYRPSVAQAKYEKRRENSRKEKLLADPALASVVRRLIEEEQWSPEEISNRLGLEQGIQISYPTIYRALSCGMMERKYERVKRKGRYPLQRHLRRKNRPAGSQKSKFYANSAPKIHDRPEAANQRIEAGHIEGDTVHCKIGKAHILTFVDRKTRYLWTGCCYNKKPEAIAQEMIRIFRTMPKGFLKSITLDRGVEFKGYETVTKAVEGAAFYFADPHSPWQRGTNENTNGLLRQYIPKHTYKVPFNEDLLRLFTHKLNHRPRKCLGWKTPHEVLFDEVLRLT